MEEFRVPSDPGIQIYVRNKCAAGMTNFSADKTVLYVHGATYPSETAFDLRLDGVSWMDYVAQQGYDVYLLDVRGYGQSTRPPQMDTPAYMAQNLFPKLTGAPYKRYVELGEGTHTIIMEKNRMNLFREVQLFLDENHAAAK